MHIAFTTQSRAEVDAFYRAALSAGGKDNGARRLRPHYHPSYYGAFVFRLEGRRRGQTATVPPRPVGREAAV